MVKTWSTPVRAEDRGMVLCNNCGSEIFKSALDCGGFMYVRCVSCGLAQMNPQPAGSEVIKRYSQLFGKDYLSYELENEAAYLKLQQLALVDSKFSELEKNLFSQAEVNAPPNVLDVGCATGALLSFLRDRGWRVTGVEISPCAEYARNERNLDVRNLPLKENNFPQDSFDVILASHLIEHLNDPRSFLVESHRILRSGGRVFITTPNISGFQARLTGSGWRSAIFDHLYLFSARTLTKLLESAGFTIERIDTWGGLAAGLAPSWLKKIADFLVKRLGCGDVMIVRAVKTGN
ncbi:MAG: class I SAM-dependent methyltransferase [Treponema sp.]|jgi:2-polyprenyl-3-methyl-5-hydroxy-6-metoxy-1,4-benzoquinol methylase|nr:class I SAM-dependent methyltransferase [Treponema sp.]